MSSNKRKARIMKAKKVSKTSTLWKDKELLDLAAALQYYGFGETEKIADALRTKDENTLKYFLATEISKLRHKTSSKEFDEPGKKRCTLEWSSADPDNLKNWPNSRAWRRLLFDQLLQCVRKNDYSKLVLEDLFETFYEEAEEVSDPQVMNMKAIYKYFLDCIRGNVPAELSPVDSAIVLMLSGQLMEMQKTLNFEEEKKFIKNFKTAKTFAPIKVKEEFKDRTIKRTEAIQNSANFDESTSLGSAAIENSANVDLSKSQGAINTKAGCSSYKAQVKEEKDVINVVEEMYMNLTKHRKLVQSLNPLNIPVWTLVKEQGYIQNKCDLSPRVPSRRK